MSALLAYPLAICAQSHPDFSGIWELEGKGHNPVTVQIEQTPAVITIGTRTGKGAEASMETLTYKLEGEEASVSDAGITTKAHWDGPKLIAETARSVHGAAVTTVHTISLNSTGQELTIEKTLIVQHGYRSLKPRNTGTGKEVYIRVKSPIRKQP